MPISTPSRSSIVYAAPSSNGPSSRHYSQPMSPSTASYPPTVTSGGQAGRLNVVTRIAIEGRAKQGEEGASIKMYMKLAVPVNSITPGSTIALFPEENVKILTSQVHPLDSNSAPYSFSSSTSPLLHNAARALNLPARLATTFQTAHHLSSSPIASGSASLSHPLESKDAVVPPVDSNYTGQILVSGYHIAYVLPKHFLERGIVQQEGELDRLGHSLHGKRRLSISDRSHAHFMAAIDMWVPYVTRPPRFPYLLSIPTPRCLHNNIRLRIFPPSSTAASFASLSSLEDDTNSWDLTSDPHVTRATSNRITRTGSYNHFADDESSDSSTTGFSDGFGIQGTFPSTDRVRVRWAKPAKFFEAAGESGDVRRRVGVKDVKSETTCTVLGKRQNAGGKRTEGIVMNVECKASCKGIWFPGVATLLGMDIGLVVKNADVTWLDESSSGWSVNGGVGFQGFNVAATGEAQNNTALRPIELLSPHISASGADDSSFANGRLKEGLNSNTSLLRAPLPSHNVAEYSFEGLGDVTASASSHLGTISSVPSLSQSDIISPPGAPLTLHVNMNDVLPPNKLPFTFTIAGTVLVTPRHSPSQMNGVSDVHPPLDYIHTTEPINLPYFTVLAADVESTKIVVRNETDGSNAAVEVFSPSGDIYKDPQARKTVLQKGGSTRCSEGGGRIALKIIGSRYDRIPTHSHTLTGSSEPRAPPSVTRPFSLARQNWHGPQLIHSVELIVTPLLSRHSPIPDAYAVRIHLNMSVNIGTDWLEFGLARVGPSSSRTPLPDNRETCSQKVHIAAASVDGVPVHYAITSTEKQRMNEALPGVSFETVGTTEWASWVKIQVGASTGDNVVIDYIVTTEPTRPSWFLSWSQREIWDLMLPTFTFPVGRLGIRVESITGFAYSLIQSNLAYEHVSSRGRLLLHFSGDDIFSPRVCLGLRHGKSKNSLFKPYFACLVFMLVVVLAISPYRKSNLDFRWLQSYQETIQHPAHSNPVDLSAQPTVTVTLATTITDCTSSPRLHRSILSHYDPPPMITSTATPLPPSSRPFAIEDAPPPLPSPSRDSLSLHLNFSLWELLGLDNFLVSLSSITAPDITISSAKETLSHYGRKTWDLIRYLVFS